MQSLDSSITITGVTKLVIPLVAIFLIKACRDIAYKWLENKKEEADNSIRRMEDKNQTISTEPATRIIDNYVKK